MKKLSTYEIKANKFCEKTGTTITCVYTGHRARFDNNHVTAVFSVTIQRNKKSFTFDYSDSIQNSWTHNSNLNGFTEKRKGLAPIVSIDKFFDSLKEKGLVYGHTQAYKMPSNYDILACITKYNPETFENFCSEYGYDTDSRRAEKTYHAVCEEYENVERIFGDVIEELSEIQ